MGTLSSSDINADIECPCLSGTQQSLGSVSAAWILILSILAAPTLQLSLQLLSSLCPWSLYPCPAISTLGLEHQPLAPCAGARATDSMSWALPAWALWQCLSELYWCGFHLARTPLS